MTKYPLTPGPPPTPCWKGVPLHKLNAMQVANMKKSLMGPHYAVGYGHAPSNQGNINQAPAVLPPFVMAGQAAQVERKQPQDGVIRMVGSGHDINYLITQCVVIFVGVLAIGASIGAYIVSDKSIWWGFLIMLFVSFIPMVVIVFILKDYFKRAQSKADLLDWPKE